MADFLSAGILSPEFVELFFGLEDYGVGLIGVCRCVLFLWRRMRRFAAASSFIRLISASVSPLDASMRMDCSLRLPCLLRKR